MSNSFSRFSITEGLIKQSPSPSRGRSRWNWDLQAIRSAEITDNVVNLLLSKLRRLPPETQEALRLAACIGNRFDVDTLALIQKSTPEKTFECLRPAVEAEVIRPLSELTASDAEDALSPLLVQELGFQHDRIQQAAYGLIQEDQKQHVHLAIGRRLQTTLPWNF